MATKITNAQGYLLGLIQTTYPSAEQVSRWSGNKKRTKSSLTAKELVVWSGSHLTLTSAGEQAMKSYALGLEQDSVREKVQT